MAGRLARIARVSETRRTLPMRMLLGLLIAALFVVGNVTPAKAANTTVIPLQSTGWKYKEVARGAQAGFEAAGFDDSTWATGQAGFGSTNSVCSWNNPASVHTSWSVGTDMLVRKHFALPAGATGVRIAGTVDNNADVYVNGTLYQQIESGNCRGDNIGVDVPASALGADNVLAVRGIDLSDATYLDVEVTAGDAPSLPTLPTIDGGTFVNIRYKTPTGAGQACTTGFNAVRRADGAKVSTGAKHCITGVKLPQNDNSYVGMNAPLTINTDDDKFTFAQSLDCTPGIATRCFLPDPVKKAPRDAYAWQPDSAVPSGYVSTESWPTPLPVLGVESMAKVIKQGDKLCHYGRGLARTTGKPERCGELFSPFADSNGYYEFVGKSIDTDSGGPVFVYKRVKGKPVGVYAVGMALVADDRLCSIKLCGTKFLPMKDVLKFLSLSDVVTAPALSG